MLRLDLHVHSMYSVDGYGSPEEIIHVLKKRGLDGVAVTDHNSLGGSDHARRVAPKGFIVVPGVEVSSAEGHILAWGVEEIPKQGLSVEETIEDIRELGGIASVAHVFRNMSGIYEPALRRISSSCSVMEVFNSASLPKSNLKMMRLADDLGLGGTGGSDAHVPKYAGYGYTMVDTSDATIDGVLDSLSKGESWAEGQSLPFEYRQSRFIAAINDYFSKGTKKI